MSDIGSRVLVVLAVAALLGGAAPAGGKEKKAGKQLAKALAKEAQAFRQEALNAAGGAADDIDALVAGVDADTTPADLFELEFAMKQLNGELHFAVEFVAVHLVLALTDALEEYSESLAEGDNGLAGLYPRGFYFGDGGPIEELYEQVDRSIELAVRLVENRLRKLEKVLEKKASIGLTWNLAFPFRRFDIGLDDSGSAPSPGNRMSFAYAYAYSDLDVAGDGTICVGGRANSFDDAEVRVRGGGTGADVQVSVPTEGGVFGQDWYARITGLPEGNYLVTVNTEDVPFTLTTSIGVR